MRPLDDVRVLDLTMARAGPTCVRQLADWGADVIRIEPPATSRGEASAEGDRHGSDFQNLHRNKRSLTLDLKAESSHEVFARLVRTADVVVENMRPAVKHRLGVDYETVRALNPRVVYGSISGFGQDGPYADRGGVDQIAQGMAGLMSITGGPESGPMRVGIPVSDLSAGLFLSIGILIALHQRERTGLGQCVETSLLEAMIGMLDFQATRWTIDHEVPTQAGNHHPTLIPMGCFATADGHINIAGSGGRLWTGFCHATGLDHLLEDPRFATPADRSTHRGALNELVAAQLAEGTTDKWVEVLNGAGVPAGPVNTMDRVFDDAQVQHLGMTQTVKHPALGDLDIIRSSFTLSDAPTGNDLRPAPDAGDHSDEILEELGIDPQAIGELRAKHVI